MGTPEATLKVKSTRSKNPFATLSADERKRLGAMFGVIFFLLFGGLDRKSVV